MNGAVLWFFVGLLVLISVLPLLRISHGLMRSLAIPRLQILAVAAAFAFFIPFYVQGLSLWAMLLLLSAVILLQAANIARFTPLWHKQSLSAPTTLAREPSRRVSLLASNVKMSNRRYDRLITLVQQRQPDLFMAMETDDAWVAALQTLKPLFDHHVEHPQDNAYGMVLYSRLPLRDIEVRDLLVEGVPSIRTAVRLGSGDWVRLYVVHPEPPVPHLDSNGRDAEIGLIGIEADTDSLPGIVAGDLNDVAWSHTTRRFQRLCGYLDPRVGRGFYNTFHAGWPLFRWPLDHLFHHPRFRLIEMERLENIGSDHFPMYFSLALAEDPAAEETPDCSRPQERATVKTMAERERERDREAIGSDWEREA